MNEHRGKRPRARDGRIAPGLAGMAAAVVVLIVLVPTALVALTMDREKSRRTWCMFNQRSVALALKRYAQDFDDRYPWRYGVIDPKEAWIDLGMVCPTYTRDYRVLLCPSSGDMVLDVAKAFERKHDSPLSPIDPADNTEVISFAYSYDSSGETPTGWSEQAKPTLRLVADKKAGIPIEGDDVARGNHGDTGRNVTYNDGHSRWNRGAKALDPDAEDDKVGVPDADDYTKWWSDPPWYGEGMERKEEGAAEDGE